MADHHPRLDLYGRPIDLAREAEERRIEEEHREGDHDTQAMLHICQSCAENDSDRRWEQEARDGGH